MPTHVHPPDSSVTPEPPSLRHYFLKAPGTQIYLAVAAVAILVAFRLAAARLTRPQRGPSWAPSGQLREAKERLGLENRKDSAASYGKQESAERPPWARDQRGVRLSVGRKPPQALLTAGLLPLGAHTGYHGPTSHHPRAMDGIDNAQRKDDGPGSAPPAGSRGVSTTDPSVADSRRQRSSSPRLSRHSQSPAEGRKPSRSPHSSPQTPSPRHHSSSGSGSSVADGASGGRSKGKGLMEGHGSGSGSVQGPGVGDGIGSAQFGHAATHFASTSAAEREHALQPRHFSRPPPPPPLTPPTLSSPAFPFRDRRPSYAISIPPELEPNFFQQPNPDYMADSTSTDAVSSSPLSAMGAPRRRSYTKSVSIVIPIPTTTSASSSTETMTSGETFSPSSYPSTSPLLPPPPPHHEFPYEYQFVGGPGGPGIELSTEEIDLHGEIISAMDDAGHGWKRHTRVYGGGVCLACAAAGGEGGFYGDKVPLEDRR